MVTIQEQQETESARLEAEITRLAEDSSRLQGLYSKATTSGERAKWSEMLAANVREGRKLVEGRTLISKGYTYEDIVAGASQYAVAAARRKAAITQYVSGLSSVEKSQYEAFRRKGYTVESAQKLTAWSSKYQMTPTGDVAARVLAGEDVKPFGEPIKKAPTYTLFGKVYAGEEVERFRGMAEAPKVYQPTTPFGEFFKAPTIPQAEVVERGGIFFTPEEARARELPVRAGLFGAYGYLPAKEIPKAIPLIKYAPEKTKAYWKSLIAEPSEITEVDIRKFEAETSFKELFKKGMVSSIVRKFAREKVGEPYFRMVAGVVQPTLTEKQIKRGGVIMGEAALFYGFAPLMKTGAATLQEVIGKGRFAPLTKHLKPKAEVKFTKVLGVERKLLMKKTFKEQAKYLAKIKKQLKTPEQEKGFKLFIEKMIEKQVIKIPTYEVGAPATIKVYQAIPEMKSIGALLGGTSILKELLKRPKAVIKPEIKLEEPKLDVKQKVKVKLMVTQKEKVKQIAIPKLKSFQLMKQVPKQSSASKQILKQSPMIRVITKQIPKTEQVPRFKFPYPTISMKPKPMERGYPFPFFPLLPRRELEPKEKIIKVRKMILPTKYRPSFVALGLGIKAPRIPKAYWRGMGALIVRPIITRRKKKKKK